MTAERLCGWHGISLTREGAAVFLTLGYWLVIWRPL